MQQNSVMKKAETTPLYKKLIEDLKKAIDGGKYKISDLLPLLFDYVTQAR